MVLFLLQLQAQSERLVKINIELRRKNQTHRKHARSLMTERVDLETQLAEKEHQVSKVKYIGQSYTLRKQKLHL